MKKENLWLSYQNEDKEKLQAICERYKNCLDEGKTERECIDLYRCIRALPFSRLVKNRSPQV